MMSKLIFFDIDGTLWDDNMQIPESTKLAFKRLRKKGHRLFICSGRARSNIHDEELLGLGFDGLIASCGNHIEMDGKIVYENILSDELTKQVVELTNECYLPVVLEGPDYHWIDVYGFDEDPFVEYLFKDMGKAAIPLHGYTPDMRINKFSADVLERTDYERVKKELGEAFDFIEHEANVIEAVPKGTSKATGIKWLCDYLGVSVEDTYAVGDSVNDLDMLNFVGHSIAMGNGTNVAKDAAEFVTKDIHEDGILYAMEHYGLI